MSVFDITLNYIKSYVYISYDSVWLVFLNDRSSLYVIAFAM